MITSSHLLTWFRCYHNIRSVLLLLWSQQHSEILPLHFFLFHFHFSLKLFLSFTSLSFCYTFSSSWQCIYSVQDILCLNMLCEGSHWTLQGISLLLFQQPQIPEQYQASVLGCPLILVSVDIDRISSLLLEILSGSYFPILEFLQPEYTLLPNQQFPNRELLFSSGNLLNWELVSFYIWTITFQLQESWGAQ